MKTAISQKTILAPLPVFVIATYDQNGIADAMNAAWGGQCDYHLVALNLSTEHKTVTNLRNTGAFTLSLATVETMQISDYFGIISANKLPDKTKNIGVHVTKSANVNAPIIEEYPLTMECRVVSMTDDGEGGTRVVGEVVNLLVEEYALDENNKVNLDRLHLISYDPEHHTYRSIGHEVGRAFSDGKTYLRNDN